MTLVDWEKAILIVSLQSSVSVLETWVREQSEAMPDSIFWDTDTIQDARQEIRDHKNLIERLQEKEEIK